MCSKTKAPKPVQPKPIQPPAMEDQAPSVRIGAEDPTGTKRKKIGRQELRSSVGVDSGSGKSGVGV